jgi:transcription initiation factor TFIIIB Brf1 subunit/transcription initiation factor TFIIB
VNILQEIEQTMPPASARKASKPTEAEAIATAEDENLTTILSEIDRLISDVVMEKEVVATISYKGKKIDETSSEGANLTYNT